MQEQCSSFTPMTNYRRVEEFHFLPVYAIALIIKVTQARINLIDTENQPTIFLVSTLNNISAHQTDHNDPSRF